MRAQPSVTTSHQRSGAAAARERLLAGIPVNERRLQLAGISTAVLEGGDGPAVVLLHGPGEFAGKWRWVMPALCESHRVVAPDLPGHGASEAAPEPLDAARVLDWLAELIEQTCPSPPTVVGQIIGGAIAARFAAERSDRLGRLVLVDSLGLAPFSPDPEFGRALTEFMAAPTEATSDRLWSRCTFDLERLRHRMDNHWEDLKAYHLERARTPALQHTVGALMEQFGMPAIPSADLERITVPTTLIWGRHDLATDLEVAEAASARYGWPLEVIDNAADDPALEQPEAFLTALHAALGSTPRPDQTDSGVGTK